MILPSLQQKSHRLTYIILGSILLISIFFHFFRLHQVEFIGEDEALVMSKIVRMFHWQSDIRNLGALLTTAHPPMRYLVALPFVGIFGPTEFWLRFIHGLAGVLCTYWVFRIGRLIFNTPTALLAALLLSVSSMSATYRSANGIGVFTLFLLIALEMFIRFDLAKTDQSRRRWLNYTALFLGLATTTFSEGGMFFLAVVGIIWVKKVPLSITWVPLFIYSVIVGGYLVIWNVLPSLAVYFGLLPPVISGNTTHLWQRLSNVGTFNLASWVGALIGTNSLSFLVLFLGVSLLARKYIWAHSQLTIIYFLPHSLVWLVGLKYPCGHGAYVTPLLTIVMGGGIWHLWQHYAQDQTTRKQMLKGMLICALGGHIILAGWHNYVLNLQNQVQPKLENFVYYDDRFVNVPCGAPGFHQIGQQAAGLFIRQHGNPNDRIVTDFGGTMELYYAGLPHLETSLAELEAALADIAEMKRRQIHFLVVQNPDSHAFTQSRQPTAIVFVRETPTLYIYDLWQPTDTPIRLQAELKQAEFYQHYATLQAIRPSLSQVAY